MSDEWTHQISVKVDGQHLLNLRSDDAVGFYDMLKIAVENREAILAACATLEGSPRQQAAAPPSPTGRPPVVSQGGSRGERGPLEILGVEVQTEKRDGTPMDGALYKIKLSDRTTPSTFVEEIGQSARTLFQLGEPVYVTTKPGKDPKYTNLTSIRGAK